MLKNDFEIVKDESGVAYIYHNGKQVLGASAYKVSQTTHGTTEVTLSFQATSVTMGKMFGTKSKEEEEE